MTLELDAVVDEYMSLPYRIEIYYDEDYWAAELPELPGLVAGHETWEGLQGAIEDAKRAYFTAALERKMVIPRPVVEKESYSGRVMLRLSKTLHASAVKRARRECVSLNTLITIAVAKEVSWETVTPGALEADAVAEGSSARRSTTVLRLSNQRGFVPWPGKSPVGRPTWSEDCGVGRA
jgi:antitoxin HicB